MTFQSAVGSTKRDDARRRFLVRPSKEDREAGRPKVSIRSNRFGQPEPSRLDAGHVVDNPSVTRLAAFVGQPRRF